MYFPLNVLLKFFLSLAFIKTYRNMSLFNQIHGMNRVRGTNKRWITESAPRHTRFFISRSEDAHMCFSFLFAQGQTPWILMIFQHL